MAKIEWCVPKNKKSAKKYDWYKSGLSRLLKRPHGSVEDSLNKQFGVPVVNPRKKKNKRRIGNNDILR